MNNIIESRSLYGEVPLTKDILVVYDEKSFHFPSDSADTSKISELLEACVPSGFGMNEKTVVDTTYRNCKELKPDNFTLSNNYGEIVPVIVAQIANILEAPKPIYPSLNKLCVYDTDGFFKEHVDTPKTNIFASLVICLPTNYEGGELIVEDDSFDLSSTSSIKWCAFYSDCRHRIEKVTKGFRATLTYDLLYIDLPQLAPHNDLLYKNIETSINKLYKDHNIDPASASSLDTKFVIGIPLSSQYPTRSPLENETPDYNKPILKGIDRKVMAILHDLGFTTDLKAVYKARFPYYFYRFLNSYLQSQKLTSVSGLEDVYKEYRPIVDDSDEEAGVSEDGYVISDVWNGYADHVCEEIGYTPFWALYNSGGRVISNLNWLREPQCSYIGKSYIAYGNEASAGVLYMDGCILAYK